jgi:hypothetical protein
MRANVFFFHFFYGYLSGILCKKDLRYSLKCARTVKMLTMTSVKELIIKKYLQNQTYGSIFGDLSKFNKKQNDVIQTVKSYIETRTSFLLALLALLALFLYGLALSLSMH